MVRRFRILLFLVFSAHILVSLAFIINPPFVKSSQASGIYRKYLLPGPFFREDRIADNYSLYLSRKMAEQWSPPIKLGSDAFVRFHSGFNMAELYRSEFERALYKRLIYQTGISSEVKVSRPYQQLHRYITRNYFPIKNDSFRMVIVNRRALNAKISVDTLYQFTDP